MAEAKLIQAIGDAVHGAGALLFSDYAKRRGHAQGRDRRFQRGRPAQAGAR